MSQTFSVQLQLPEDYSIKTYDIYGTRMSVSMTSILETSKGNIPKRGGVHHEYGIYLGGEDLDDNWDLQPGYPFKYARQCHKPKAVVSLMKTLTEARESVSVLKFDGMLVPVNENDKELDNEDFILTIELLVGEYGQQKFTLLKLEENLVNVLENYHMVSEKVMIAIYEARMIYGKPESFDHFKKDDLIISRSLVGYDPSKD